MKAVGNVTALLGLVLLLAGCQVHYDSDPSVTHRFGSDFFGVGGMLNLTDSVPGDAFLAGGHVAIASMIQGDLVVAGGEVSVGGNVGDDLYAAGGNVQLDAVVSGNARIAGGDVSVGPATVVAGAVSMSGARVDFQGDSHGYLQANGGTVRIDGTVHGDAEINAQDVEIGPETRIGGRLIVRSPHAPDVPAGAVISGGLEYHEADASRYFEGPDETVRHVARGVGTVLWFVGVFLAGVLFTLLFPGYSTGAAQLIGRQPLQSIGIGFAVLVCGPALALVLLITVVGIPLALLLVPLYLLLMFLGWITTALFLGQRGLAALRGVQSASTGWQLLALLAALVGLWALGRLPYFGGWIRLVALLAGIGALVAQAWRRRERAAAT